MKARLLMRDTCADNNGCMTGWTYSSIEVEIPEESMPFKRGKPEIFGAEWLPDEPASEGGDQ